VLRHIWRNVVRTLNINMAAGKWFTKENSKDGNSYIINQVLADRIGTDQVIGMDFTM
jgi:putative ABC transport system permease protein